MQPRLFTSLKLFIKWYHFLFLILLLPMEYRFFRGGHWAIAAGVVFLSVALLFLFWISSARCDKCRKRFSGVDFHAIKIPNEANYPDTQVESWKQSFISSNLCPKCFLEDIEWQVCHFDEAARRAAMPRRDIAVRRHDFTEFRLPTGPGN